MLKELKIENLAIIDELDLEFEKGFAVLTGETGAGKSIILAGINLLIGEKASVDMIREGEENLLAQGIFEINEEQMKKLEDLGLNIEDNELIIRRYFNRNGKAKIFINNVRISTNELKSIMSNLVDIVGQHSHQMLLNKDNHIKLLDSFLKDSAKTLKKEIYNIVEEYKNLKNKIEAMEKNRLEVLEKKEFFEFQLQEIKKLKLIRGEDEELEIKYKKIFNTEKIKERLLESLEYLREDKDSALSAILNSKRNIEYLSEYDSRFSSLAERIENIYYELEDCVDELSDINKEISFEAEDINVIMKRYELLKAAKSKYKRSLDELIEYQEDLENKLSSLENNNFESEVLNKKLENIKREYFEKASLLSSHRKEAASNIEKLLMEELKFLNMENASLKIMFEENEKISNEGFDEVEFLISTNLGQKLKPLVKIASGGEVSRIMLALKVIFSKVDNIPILIFDEIDTGVGGETVRKIALKLQEIGQNTQIISITHSPVIASKANQQFYIEKSVENSQTISRVKKLNPEDRIKEIGRMLVGEKITDNVLEIAKNMLNEV